MKSEHEVKVGDKVRIDRYEYGAPAGTVVKVTGVSASGNILYKYNRKEFQTGRGACSVQQWVQYGDPADLE